jgi:ribosome-binding protein aMBF1 (putative translation factor)
VGKSLKQAYLQLSLWLRAEEVPLMEMGSDHGAFVCLKPGVPPMKRKQSQEIYDLVEWSRFIKDARVQLGLTQVEFAAAIGAGVASVCRWERRWLKPNRSSRCVLIKRVEALLRQKRRHHAKRLRVYD